MKEHTDTNATSISSNNAQACNNSEQIAPKTCCGIDQLKRENIPDDTVLYEVADLFKVFGDTTRIKILSALMEADLCVADIAEVVGVSQSAVSHQLRILKQAHLVKFTRAGRSLIYSLSDNHVHTIIDQGISHVCE